MKMMLGCCENPGRVPVARKMTIIKILVTIVNSESFGAEDLLRFPPDSFLPNAMVYFHWFQG